MSYDSVVFSEGVHYPTDKDGNPDMSKPLRWEDGAYRDAVEDEPLHNDVHQLAVADVNPREITLDFPGQTLYPVGAHVVSSDGVTYFLANEDGTIVHTDHPLEWDGKNNVFRAKGP